MKKIALICARKNSERVPNKNVTILHGKPLIKYTIDASIQAKIFDNIFVNSDDERVLEIAKKSSIDIYKRPNHLGDGNVYVIEVVKDFIKSLKINQDTILCILFPTCPLRDSNDILNAYKIFKSKGYSRPVAAVTEYEYPVDVSLDINSENTLEPTFGFIKSTRHNDNKVTYRANYSVMFNTARVLLNQTNLIGNNPIPYIMPHERSIDIDNHYQMKVASFFLKNK